MIKHRGSLGDAMNECAEFETVEDMYKHIMACSSAIWGKSMFDASDLTISENHGADARIGWKETRYVCTRRMGESVYETPQCIGMCSME